MKIHNALDPWSIYLSSVFICDCKKTPKSKHKANIQGTCTNTFSASDYTQHRFSEHALFRPVVSQKLKLLPCASKFVFQISFQIYVIVLHLQYSLPFVIIIIMVMKCFNFFVLNESPTKVSYSRLVFKTETIAFFLLPCKSRCLYLGGHN